jgi:hypothetical protein
MLGINKRSEKKIVPIVPNSAQNFFIDLARTVALGCDGRVY